MGFNLKSVSFDAKSRDLTVRGIEKQPLTVNELQRRIFEGMQEITKKDVQREK